MSFTATSPSPVKARYIKVEIETLGLCPSWHYGVGYPAWFFLDEVPFGSGHHASEQELYAAFLIYPAQGSADFFVHGAKYLPEHLYHAHLASKCVEESGELHSYDASAYDREAFGKGFQPEYLSACDDCGVVPAEAGHGRNHRLRTGAYEQPGGKAAGSRSGADPEAAVVRASVDTGVIVTYGGRTVTLPA